EYLLKVRRDMEEWDNIPEEVWEELYAAEGSDWFWWFGEDMETPEGDKKWDEMYRETLKNIYILKGKTPPNFLDEPIVE
ncbi:MAG: glycoside hydrolase, partial [bacterium (Candidatus Stahlbacteria) CG23_combo_of_CG06-09_8_20_14_all_40_9]